MAFNKHAFCTICTPDYAFKAAALAKSLFELSETSDFYILVTGKIPIDFLQKNLPSTIKWIPINKLKAEPDLVSQLFKKYKKHSDQLRWSLKSLLLIELLSSYKIEKAIYVDNDICFFNNPQFLFDLLNENNILLSPHWRPSNPNTKPIWFETNFREGIFNAGFIAANKNGIEALKWWANACIYKCQRNFDRGLFDDQKYLDLLPALFPKTYILQHKGCNVAFWNIDECSRVKTKDSISIAPNFPIIFIHFTNTTINGILEGPDFLLSSFLDKYLSYIHDFKPTFSFKLTKGIERIKPYWLFLKWRLKK